MKTTLSKNSRQYLEANIVCKLKNDTDVTIFLVQQKLEIIHENGFEAEIFPWFQTKLQQSEKT